MLTVELNASDRYWSLSFCDNGPGVSQQQLESMFEPFQSNFEGGTGLGLALVYQILQAHHTKYLVRSELGAGFEFVLRFLRAEEPDGAVPAMLQAEKA
jgi:signal transduction histidine kinase